jgi:hypothetical protein
MQKGCDERRVDSNVVVVPSGGRSNPEGALASRARRQVLT